MSIHADEPARELPEYPDLGHHKGQPEDLLKADQAPTPAKSGLMAAQPVIRWLRWAVVLGLVYSAWSGLLLYYVLQVVGLYSCPLFLSVAAGAKIAPRNRLTTAIVLAAVVVANSFWGHLLSNQPHGITSYQLIIAALQQIALQGMPAGGPVRHFIQEALGAVLGVVYIFWSEKAQGSVASVRTDPPPS